MTSPIAGMTLDQRIGQLVMAGFHGTEPSDEIIRLIEREHVGGVILFSRNLRDARQTRALTTRLQAIARAAGHPYPLLIATDQENGLVRRLGADATVFPGGMALGAVGDEDVTFAVARATARELRALGITMNFAPVADVNNNPANPVIGVRSFGENPAAVAAHTAAAVRGHLAGGVIPTLKHFPGHGDTAMDSHLGLPIVPFDLERLERVELAPFRAGLAAGAECVMTAHVALPRLTGGEPIPAILAPEVVRGLLRERLGFAGVAVTDSLEMRAIADTTGIGPGAARAILAGNDLVLISHVFDEQMEAITAIRRAASDGTLAPDIITAAVERVLDLKRRHLAWDELPDEAAIAEVGSPEHRALAARAYACSTTLVRDADSRIPLRLAPDARLLLVLPAREIVSQAMDVAFDGVAFAATIAAHHATTSALTVALPMTDAAREEVCAAVAGADLALLVTINARLEPAQAELARLVHDHAPRAVTIAACDPYDLLALPGARTALATYDYSAPALAAAAAVLFGAAVPVGRLPITLTLPSS
jgi:beta-N-acetylhexosaminidase